MLNIAKGEILLDQNLNNSTFIRDVDILYCI